ncbi:MAG: hypothetical protein AAGH76_03385 [Pseudomonadota bacterium]
MSRQIVFKRVAPIPEQSGMAVVSKFVSENGTGLFLYVESDSSKKVTETFESGIGIFPRSRMSDAKKFTLVMLSNGAQEVLELPPLRVTFPLIDVFPDGRVLVSGSRSQWRGADDFDLNGLVIDPSACSERSFLLGDGIESSAVDSCGRIWVSYFDEGIFGNFGWGHPGPKPIGSPGLNCFSHTGSLIWSFPVQSEIEPISDCYAMNVSGESVAVYAYTEFDLCRISPDLKIETFTTGLKGCHHFAITDTKVMFTGQYDDDISVGYTGELADGRLRDIKAVEFVQMDGAKIKAGQFVGRGDTLHFFDDQNWYSTQVDS